MELQPSLEVTSALGAFSDFPLPLSLLTLLAMIVTGILGGLANFYMAERQYGRRESKDWRRHLVLGVVTALTAPLLLNMLSSNLLASARAHSGALFVFAAFCLIYVVAARRVFENPSAFYQEEIERLRNDLYREMENLRRDQDHLRQCLAAYADAPAADRTPDADPREMLTYNDIEVLRALADESYVYGNLAALTEKTTLGRELISQRLAILKETGLIETRISDKNVLHWIVSARGQQILSEALSGQDNAKKTA
ncbi:MAG: helix-turn-helix domain-containing protein [Zoogloeaceae bacterium]|nr:helix-turn-helix domain-containing protein [Zoogloeaceae bacterium]